MGAKIKLSFKKEPKETGLAAIGYPYPSTQIKIDGKQCGAINAPTHMSKDGLWSVMFSVKKIEPDNNPNTDWKWITMKAKFETEPLAREFVKEVIEHISLKYTFHFFE